MSALAGFGVLAALAVIVALLLLGARAAQKLGLVRALHDPALCVLRRAPLGPRQGVAVVRVAGRTMLLSVGDGGVRTLAELSAHEALAFEPDTPAAGTTFRATLERRLRRTATLVLLASSLLLAAAASAQTTPVQRVTLPGSQATSLPTAPATTTRTGTASAGQLPNVQLSLGTKASDGLQVSGTVGTVLVLGALTLLPAILLLMTGFTRILIVLHLLRQALGTQTAPPGQLLTALALILTGFVMAPTVARINESALQPWLDGRIDEVAMLKGTIAPLREFMLAQTPPDDVNDFVELSGVTVDNENELPTTVLTAAFATSELRTAFKLGFAIFLPFVVIDLVMASVLSGMGMFMLPPTMIALPCKLLLFVLVDGWTLTVQSLVGSFRA